MKLGLVRFADRRIGIPLCWAVSHGLRPPVRPHPPGDPRRILLMKWVGFGNLVLASPAISAIRRRYPLADITFVTLSANRGLLERFPDLDRVYYFDVSGLKSVARETARLIAFLHRERFDLVIDFEQFSRYSAIMTGLSGAPVRVGFDTPEQNRAGVYTHPVRYRDGAHMADVFGDLARTLEGEVDARQLIAPVLVEDDITRAEVFIAEEALKAGEFVILHPGTGLNAPQRRWPPERYAELADRIAADTGLSMVLSGSPSEKALLERINGLARTYCSLTAGRLNLAGFAALMQKSAVLVCSDSGPVHLAAALNVPTVALYGPNSPELYGPVGSCNTILWKRLPCSPCITNLNDKLTHCPHGECIQQITVEEIYLAIRRHLARRPETRPAGASTQRLV